MSAYEDPNDPTADFDENRARHQLEGKSGDVKNELMHYTQKTYHD